MVSYPQTSAPVEANGFWEAAPDGLSGHSALTTASRQGTLSTHTLTLCVVMRPRTQQGPQLSPGCSPFGLVPDTPAAGMRCLGAFAPPARHC